MKKKFILPALLSALFIGAGVNSSVDEVNANNEDIEQQAISYKSEIEDFFERINKAFGVKISVYDMNEIMAPEQESEEEPEDVSEN